MRLDAVPGRMERVDRGQPFTVIVDYAHTAEALATVLDELRATVPDGAGLIAVFGSAGERDTQKRPAMGRVAGERCRVVVVTDEDPRGEDRLAILEAIASGAREAGKRDGADLLVVPDRAEAIGLAAAWRARATSSCSRARVTSARSRRRRASCPGTRPRRRPMRWRRLGYGST